MPSDHDSNQPGGDTSRFLRRARDGDPEGLELAVKQLTPLLLTQADYRLRGRIRHLVDAEDLVNETWLRTLPKLGNLHPRDGRITPVALTYLSQTMRHLIGELLRASHRPREPQALDTTGAESLPDWLPVDTQGVVVRVIQAERHHALHQAIRELADADREIIVLRAIEQNSIRAVASLLELTSDAVKQRYHRAMRRLRKRMPGTVFDELEEPDESTEE